MYVSNHKNIYKWTKTTEDFLTGRKNKNLTWLSLQEMHLKHKDLESRKYCWKKKVLLKVKRFF